jgi:HEPN domain-containing protein
MNEQHEELARAFLLKAHHDLFTAHHTLAASDSPTDTPCFHSQQAVEKALKALLTFHEIISPRTHDLLVLLDIGLSLAPELDQYREIFSVMTSYAVEIRYPDDWYEPERQEAEEALKIAEEVVEKIESLCK